MVRVGVALGEVGIDGRLVGVRAVHQPLGADAVENPGQLRHFGDVGLAVEGDGFGVKAAGEPGGGDGERRAVDLFRIVAFDDAVVVGEKEEGFFTAGAAFGDGRADGADVVAEVGDAGGGDAGQDTFLAHADSLR